ncbi:polysaccharide deacetylase family protein [Paraclostridium sordellii]|uniref:polysaccharide deacetylase family protein n=1 Tax=Paraclostridium sordellii TaxID=1505 RepID=UPI0009BDBF0F
MVEEKSNIPKNSRCITSDDGYLSNYDIIYPILKKLSMKDTIFIIRNYIDNTDKTNIKLTKLTWNKIK